MTTPTQSEKRIAIAEHFGWIWGQPWGKNSLRFVAPKGYKSRNWRCPNDDNSVILKIAGNMSVWERKESIIDGLPDYFADLNACHEAENALTDEQYVSFGAAILEMSGIQGDFEHVALCRAFLSAPAALRAEAIWRTLCK